MSKVNYLLLFFLIMSASACIDEIEFPIQESEPKVVVDGSFSDIEEEQIIKLSFSNEANVSAFRPLTNAMVRIEEEGGQDIVFDEKSPGIYTQIAKAEKGKKYRLKISLPDGSEVTSRFQPVPNAFPIDSITIEEKVTSILNESGRRETLRNIEFFAHTYLDIVPDDFNLRYDLESVYRINEIRCFPLQPIRQCYIYEQDLNFDVKLVELKQKEEPVDLKSFLYRRKINYVFGEVYSLKVDVLSYNDEEYIYWKTLRDLFKQEGNVTDILPARLRSNLMTNNGEEVFGSFAVVGKSTAVQFVRNADFETFVNPFCGAPGFPPFPRPDICCNCIAYPGADYTRPPYW